MCIVRSKVRMAELQGTQTAGSLCDQLQVTEEELQTRLSFLSLGQQDRKSLIEIHDVISTHVDEIFVVETYYHAAMQRLEGSLCQLKDAHRQLEGLSRQDPLTSVNDRRALMEALVLEFHRSRRYRHPFALLFLDVEHFKKINDRHGHTFGDQMLCHVVQSARGTIRPPDIIGRYGGEEFVIGLVECDRAGALQIADPSG